MATPGIVGDRHYKLAQEIRKTLAQYEALKDIVAMLGLEQLSPEDRNAVARARRLERFLTQPFFTTEMCIRDSSNLTPAFRGYGVGTLDKRVRPYEIDATNVKAIADAHCSIRSAANAGVKVGHELSELRKGNFKNAQASGCLLYTSLLILGTARTAKKAP